MSSPHSSIAKHVTLKAWEEVRPPIGKQPDPNRDTSFASVFLVLENSESKEIKFVVELISIQDETTAEVYLSSEVAQIIQLKPLENAVIDFHLSDKGRFPEQAVVKAKMIYSIGGYSYKLDSNSIIVKQR